MSIKVKFFANFRALVGRKELELEGGNLKELLENLTKYDDRLEEMLFLQDEELRRDITIMVNGRPVNYLEGLKTSLEEEDTVAIFPLVGGG